MADFNFGFVGHIAEVARHADANIDIGPVDTGPITILSHDGLSYVTNADRVHTVYGSKTDFIWGQKWGNFTTRVAK